MARDTDQQYDCFADEIAIDFPSVGHLVERVRDAFLGERSGGDDTHTTEVSLSIRDASKGTVVGMEVPLPGTCAPCGGRARDPVRAVRRWRRARGALVVP